MIRDLMQLFCVFFRIGLFSIGGGYAMLPMLKRETIDRHGWLTEEEMLNYYAIGQATPGIIAINTATFIGFKQRGITGGIAATLGMVGPSLVIITAIALCFARFQDIAAVQRAFAGIRVAVAVMLVFTLHGLVRKAVINRLGKILAVAAFLLLAVGGVNPVPIIMAAGIAGMLFGPKPEAAA